MKLTRQGLRDAGWERESIAIPPYDIEELVAKTRKAPTWVHFGVGNIARIFIGEIADRLIREGEIDTGITCVESFDFEVVDKVFAPHDNLCLNVILNLDGSLDERVIGSLGEAIAMRPGDAKAKERLKEVFASASLQMVSFTITEKGYALRKADGEYFPFVKEDIETMSCNSTMSLVAYMLNERYLANATPIAIVSMDNVSHNGKLLREHVLEIAEAWCKRGFITKDAYDFMADETKVSFPWTMIDKITPRPSEIVQERLAAQGVEGMEIVITDKKTYIAPFVNAEGPQYLVVEDSFPNGRPPLEKAGVYMCDRDTVNAAERMKVTVCLNPIHTALAPYGCVLGFMLFADEMKDPQLSALANLVGRKEGMHVVKDPGILSPQAFIDECINVRFPNPYIPDTPQRIVVDSSQMVGIRFGETIKEYVQRYGDAKMLVGIPLAIAGWLRYMLAIDDNGEPFELSPDPMNEEITEMFKGIKIGNVDSVGETLRPILSNKNIFGSDLYEVGIGNLIEQMFKEQIAGKGAVRKTLVKYLGEMIA